jgi:hypothetical protein
MLHVQLLMIERGLLLLGCELRSTFALALALACASVTEVEDWPSLRHN